MTHVGRWGVTIVPGATRLSPAADLPGRGRPVERVGQRLQAATASSSAVAGQSDPPGPKQVWRTFPAITEDLLATRDDPGPWNHEPVFVAAMRAGATLARCPRWTRPVAHAAAAPGGLATPARPDGTGHEGARSGPRSRCMTPANQHRPSGLEKVAQ